MKIVNGVVCGELLERLVRHDSLNVLVIKNHKSYEELQSHLDVLQAYIKDIGLDLSLKILLVDSIDNVTIKNKLVEEDVDIVLDDKEVLSDKEKTSLSDNSQILCDIKGVLDEIGAFLAGNGVYWNFDEPVWNRSYSAKCAFGAGATIAAQKFFCSVNDRKISDILLKRARYLWNKTITVSYARDMLLYTLQLRRKASRRKYNDVWLSYETEINYHLTNFYFLMASTFDIVSRFLNEYYSLGITEKFKLALEKKTVLNKIKEPIPDLYRYIQNPENNKWISWLRNRRNYIAHDGTVSHAPILTEKTVKMSEEDIRRIVDSRANWGVYGKLIPRELYDMWRKTEVYKVRMENNYELVAKDVMIVEVKGGRVISAPLNSISYDYDKYSQIVNYILNIISSDIDNSSTR